MSCTTLTLHSVSSVKTLEDVKGDPNCLYLSMPVQVSAYSLGDECILYDSMEVDEVGADRTAIRDIGRV